jgi:hypothetical protein
MEITTEFNISEMVMYEGKRDKIDEINIQIIEKLNSWPPFHPRHEIIIEYHLEGEDKYVEESKLKRPKPGIVEAQIL